MTSGNLISCLGLAVILTGCATSQENPNYKYSSKYEGAQTVRQMASTQPSTNIQAVTYQRQTYQAREQANAVQTSPYQAVTSSPQTYQAQVQTQPQQSQTYQVRSQPMYIEDAVISDPTPSAPTDTEYAGQNMQGTPGYGLFAPEEVQYDYNQNIVTASTGASTGTQSYGANRGPQAYTHSPSISVPSPMMATGNYVVKQGDTIYNLSRRLCVGMDVLTQANNIGQNFAIQIGQSLNLPAPNCG